MFARTLSATALSLAIASPVLAQTTAGSDEAVSMSQSPTMNFVGDRYRVGIGIDTTFDVIGEFQMSLTENARSAWIAEGWLGRRQAGGLKLNYHWVFGATEEMGPNGPVLTDGRVAKLFVAADQNQFDDRKLTFGGGYEYQNWFLGVYGMRALTSERRVLTTIDIEEILVSGTQDGRDFTRIDVLQRTTDLFEKPYERGLGLRGGYFFDEQLVRLQGGMDYEDGRRGASQLTASLSLDKFFAESPHSVSLRGGVARQRGPLVDNRNDIRASLVYSYSFGQRNFRPSRQFREVEVSRQGEPRFEERAVASQLTLGDRTTFAFDSAELLPEARSTLNELADAIRDGRLIGEIEIVGHTCDIGTATYNQGLSERRARSVVDYLVGRGIDADAIRWSGRGLTSPRYPNDSEENRSRNRRVEVSFVTEESRVERIQVGPGETVVELVQEEVPVEAAWIRRALRNPIRHKREVDVYRFQEVSETLTEGEIVFDNRPPVANDNAFNVQRDSVDNALDVLANDSDPDGDTLSIVAVSAAANGQVSIGSGVLLYTPNAGFVGTDTFSYTIDDGFGGQATAQVTVVVQALNQPPVADDVFVSTLRTQPVEIDVLAAASDPDGDPLEIVSFSQPANGSVTQVGNRLRYQPDQLFFGEDSFVFTVGDGRGGEAEARAFIDVQFANQAPIANPDVASTPAGVPVTVDVLANDIDPDGDPLEVIEVVQISPAAATAVINADNTITFTIGATCSGLNIFRYTITDPFGATANTTVTVNRSSAGTEDFGDCPVDSEE